MTISLGDLELAVLMAVVRLRKEAYGARVREDVSARANRAYSVGAVYTTLQRLESKGLLASWITDPEPVRGGRAKRCFTVTPSGERALHAAREATRRLWAGAPRWSRA
jgi:DNA-binding PadR family transcriptional regulator